MEEIFGLAFAAALFATVFWLWKIFAPVHHRFFTWRWRIVLIGALVSCLSLMHWVLTSWASFDVVADPYYVWGYMALGLAWISVGVKVIGYFSDIRVQLDIRERNNYAAALTLSGVLLGMTCAFLGANIGDGPGVHVVLFCALLSTACVIGVAFLYASFTEGDDRITIDHDLGAAVRMGAAFIATGLVAGRAVAGDWVSVEATLSDFISIAWILLPLSGAFIFIERNSAPQFVTGFLVRNIIIAAVYLSIGIAYVWKLGPWN